MSKKTFVKILSVFFCALLIVTLAIPCFADPLDLKEKVSDDRAVGDVYYTYSFLDSYILDRGSSIDSALSLSYDSWSFDLFIGNGHYIHFQPVESTRADYVYGDFSQFNLGTVLGYQTYVRNDEYMFYDGNAFTLSENSYVYVGEDGLTFLDFSGNSYHLVDYVAYRFNTGTNWVYFGCDDDDFLAPVLLEDFKDYCLSLPNVGAEYGAGLFTWIEDHFLPLFGEIPTDEVDMGILGTWSPLQLVRAALWVSLGGVCVSGFVVLPFVLLLRLMGVKRKKR